MKTQPNESRWCGSCDLRATLKPGWAYVVRYQDGQTIAEGIFSGWLRESDVTVWLPNPHYFKVPPKRFLDASLIHSVAEVCAMTPTLTPDDYETAFKTRWIEAPPEGGT